MVVSAEGTSLRIPFLPPVQSADWVRWAELQCLSQGRWADWGDGCALCTDNMTGIRRADGRAGTTPAEGTGGNAGFTPVLAPLYHPYCTLHQFDVLQLHAGGWGEGPPQTTLPPCAHVYVLCARPCAFWVS